MQRTNWRRGQTVALLGLAALLIALFPALGAAAGEPYSLRGFALGIFLADFKIMAPPDRSIWPGARPLCSNDPEIKSNGTLADSYSINLSEAEAKAGFVRCGFFYPNGGVTTAAGLVVANIRSGVSFIFLPDRAGAMRLASIRVTAASSNYSSIKSALTKKYGRPSFVFQGYVHDAAGAKLVDETARWSNGTSKIQLDQREENEDVELMSVWYNHEELTAEGLMRLKAVLGSPTDTL